MQKTAGLLFVLICLTIVGCRQDEKVQHELTIEDPSLIKPNFELSATSPSQSDGKIVFPIDNVAISFTFLDPLRPESINSDTVKIVPARSYIDIPSHDAYAGDIKTITNYSGNTLSIRNRDVLQRGRDYYVYINGVQNRFGSFLQGHLYRFSTRRNAVKQFIEFRLNRADTRYVYTKSPDNSQTLFIYNAHNTEQPEDDTLIGSEIINGRIGSKSGAHIFFNETGKVLSYEANTFDGNLIAGHAHFVAPGANGIWGDDDDLLDSYSDHQHSTESYRITHHYGIRFRGIEPQTWANREESLDLLEVYFDQLRSDGRLQRRVVLDDLGPDGEIFIDFNGTPVWQDDQIKYYENYDYNAVGLISSYARYQSYDETLNPSFIPRNDERVLATTYNRDRDGRLLSDVQREFNGGSVAKTTTTVYEYDEQRDDTNFARLASRVYDGDRNGDLIKVIEYDSRP
jgi:hypothetical protein